MRIGMDATCWWNQRGFGRFTRELLKSMFQQSGKHTYVLFVDRPPVPEMERPNTQVRIVAQTRPVTEAAVAVGRRSLRDMWASTRAVAGQDLDVMFFPAVYSWYPVPPRLPTVVTLHDAIAERFPGLVFPDWKGRLFWNLKVRLALWQAQRVLTVSEAAKVEITQQIRIDPGRIDVVTEAADSLFQPATDEDLHAQVRSRYGLPTRAPLIVYVGGPAPHKNLAGLLEGFAIAAEVDELMDLHLVLVGDPSGAGFYSNYGELVDAVRTNPLLADRAHFTGFVPDKDLVVLYSDAVGVVLPSFSEGFGLPAVEAMACGTPVLASRAGALPEVVGDAGLYFDPYDTKQIAAAIRRLMGEPETRLRLKAAAQRRAKHFTWSRSAELTLESIERCARNS